MNILELNQLSGSGGAAGITLALQRGFVQAGHRSAMLVGATRRASTGVHVIEHDAYRNVWARGVMRVARRLNTLSGRVRGAQGISERWLPRLASPAKLRAWWAGADDWDFPGSHHLLEQTPFPPDVVHAHNLHGDFFDLRALATISRRLPTVLTLHDAWLLSGHCAHSFGCERWRSGCGNCPDLSIPPAIRRDATAENWRRKAEVYARSEFFVACPSRWIEERVRGSMLMPGLRALRTIHNGVDLDRFTPGGRAVARRKLSWPEKEFIAVFTAASVRGNVWKDHRTMREAVARAAQSLPEVPLRFFAIGEGAPAEQIGGARIEYLAHRDDVADCYRAADVYLHAARADTFPTSVIEALACGTPAIATAVGGIPEQIDDGVSGFLVPEGDAVAMAARIVELVRDPAKSAALAVAARRSAVLRFDGRRMVSDYLSLFEEAIAAWRERRMADRGHFSA